MTPGRNDSGSEDPQIRTDGGAPPDSDEASTDDWALRDNPVVDAATETDLRLVVSSMIGLYAIFIVLGLLTGLSIAGIVSTLQRVTFFAVAFGLLALALNLHWGYTGLFNIGIAGFMAVGVYTMAMLTADPDPTGGTAPGLGLPLPIGVLGGMLAAALVGGLAAIPAIRLRADYLAIVTLGISEIIRRTYNSNTLDSYLRDTAGIGTGGSQGIRVYTPSVDLAPLLGSAPDTLSDLLGLPSRVIVAWAYVIIMIVVTAAVFWLLLRIAKSPYGRVLKAIREDEVVANSLGKYTTWFKIQVFMVGCALMGLGGMIWLGSRGTVTPRNFMPIVTFYIFVALIIGGTGSNTGSIVGGIVFGGVLFQGPDFLREILRNFGFDSGPPTFAGAVSETLSNPFALLEYVFVGNFAAFRFILLGVVLILLMQYRPEGLLGYRVDTAAAVDLSDRGVGDPASPVSEAAPSPETVEEPEPTGEDEAGMEERGSAPDDDEPTTDNNSTSDPTDDDHRGDPDE